MKRGLVRVERGIYQDPDSGQVYIRTTAVRGSTVPLPPIAVAGFTQARFLVQEADRLREAGKDLRDEWADRLPARAPEPERGVGTVRGVFDAFLAERAQRVAVSDPRKSGLNKGNNTLRKSSFDNLKGAWESSIKGPLGNKRVADVDTLAVQGWLSDLARQGLAESTQAGRLSVLRRGFDAVLRPGELPPGYPWRGVAPVPPKHPLKRPKDPTKWGGGAGDEPPAVSFAQMDALAQAMRPCFRPVPYLEGLLGPRISENLGLELGHFYVDELGWLRVKVEQQYDDRTGQVVPWVKAKASKRDVVVPRALGAYLRGYAARCHGYDFDHPDPAKAGRRLVVTSTGRDFDGSFMPAGLPALMTDWHRAKAAVGLGYDQLGYDLVPHDLRKSLSSHLLERREVATGIVADQVGPAPGPGAPPSEAEAYMSARLALQALIDDAFALSGASVSLSLGQEPNRRDEPDPAADVTRTVYSRRLASNAGSEPAYRIARFVDAVVALEVPHGLSDAPDADDLTPVIAADDPGWARIDQAMEDLGLTYGPVHQLVREGHLEARLVYIADGDRDPPGPRLVISRADLDRAKAARSGLSSLGVERVLGYPRTAVRKLRDMGALQTVHFARTGYYERDSVAWVLAEVLGQLWASVKEHPGHGAAMARKYFVARLKATHYREPVRALIANPAKLTQEKVDRWLADLIEAGALSAWADGTLHARSADGIAALARRRVDEEGSAVRRGRPADPVNATRTARKKPRPVPPGEAPASRDGSAQRAGTVAYGALSAPARDTGPGHNRPRNPRSGPDGGGLGRTGADGHPRSRGGRPARQGAVGIARRSRRPGGLS
jgi:integrase